MPLPSVPLISPPALPPGVPAPLRVAADRLRQAAAAGQARGLLRGKNIGLLCERPDDPDALRFQQAAAELGATVARIRPSLAGLAVGPQVADTARVLARLYDALACQGLPPALVQQLQREAGVPVFGDLEHPSHPIGAWAEAWSAAEPPLAADAARRHLLQALLLQAVA